MTVAEKDPAQVGQTQATASSNACPYAHECKTCITGGVLAAYQRKFLLDGDMRTLAGDGLPACHHEVRDHLAPAKTGEQILRMYPREVRRTASTTHPVAA